MVGSTRELRAATRGLHDGLPPDRHGGATYAHTDTRRGRPDRPPFREILMTDTITQAETEDAAVLDTRTADTVLELLESSGEQARSVRQRGRR